MLFYWNLRSRSGDEPGVHQFTGVQFDVCGGHVCHSDCCQSVLQESEQTHWTGAREQDLWVTEFKKYLRICVSFTDRLYFYYRCWQHIHCLDNQVMGVQKEGNGSCCFFWWGLVFFLIRHNTTSCELYICCGNKH